MAYHSCEGVPGCVRVCEGLRGCAVRGCARVNCARVCEGVHVCHPKLTSSPSIGARLRVAEPRVTLMSSLLMSENSPALPGVRCQRARCQTPAHGGKNSRGVAVYTGDLRPLHVEGKVPTAGYVDANLDKILTHIRGPEIGDFLPLREAGRRRG